MTDLTNDDLTDGAYEMLRTAVTLSKQHQCRTLAVLRQRMAETYPERKEDIEAGLRYWANNVRERHPEGVPRR
jgi:hypothetical protein